MSSYIVRKNGKRRNVKYLGWLLRNAGYVTELHVTNKTADQTAEPGGCFLAAYLDGHPTTVLYCTDWASRSICLEWIGRPSLQHAVVFNFTEGSKS